jgi:hypothetical protein
MSNEIFITSPGADPEGMKSGLFWVHDDAIFWITSSLYHHGINVWDPVRGPRPLVRYIGDYTQGADDFGTDGADMVWAYGRGKRPNDIEYPTRYIMTAKYTLDPERFEPRRVRSQSFKKIGNYAFKVGCGYAAQATAASGPATQVVRLSDGMLWIIKHTPEFAPHEPLGLTCDEVFILGEIAGRWNIARIRLDSLGPGIPPD